MELVELTFFADDVGQMVTFYRSLLESEPVAESERMAIFMVGRVKILIHESYLPASGELPPDDHVAFSCQAVDAACARLVSQGLSLEMPPRDYYWGRSAYLRDPKGLQIEITQAVDRDAEREKSESLPVVA